MATAAINVSDFKEFAKTLRASQPELRRSLTRQLRAAGQLVADEAKSRVAPYSKSVPGTIKVSTARSSVSVVAGSKSNPIGGLLENGNARGSGTPSTFRHPVFGTRTTWVTQPAHPYLAPALKDKAREVNELMQIAIAEIFDQAAYF